MSSAKSFRLDEMLFPMSLIKSKIKGALRLFLVGLLILHLTSHYLHLRVPFAEFCLTAMIASSLDGGHGCHNIHETFRSKRLCATVSTAFEKSRIKRLVWFLLLIERAKWSMVLISCVSHERLLLKPCWWSTNTLCASRCVMMCRNMICSSNLHRTDYKETGQ